MSPDEMIEALKGATGYQRELNCHLWAFAIGGTVEQKDFGKGPQSVVLGTRGQLVVDGDATGNASAALQMARMMGLKHDEVLIRSEKLFFEEYGQASPREVLELFPAVICRVALEMKKEVTE